MEKSFDEITVSSLSDLQLGSSSEYQSHLNPGSSSGEQQQVQQRNSSGSGGNAAGNGNENNLNRQKRSSRQHQQQQQQQQQPVFNPSRHLDVWLANAIRGLESNSGGQDSGAGSDLLDSPTLLKGGFGEPLSLPPNLSTEWFHWIRTCVETVVKQCLCLQFKVMEPKKEQTIRIHFGAGQRKPKDAEIFQFFKENGWKCQELTAMYREDFSVYVKFQSMESMRKALLRLGSKTTFRYSDGKVTEAMVMEAGGDIQYVRIFGLTPEVRDEMICEEMEKYGKVKQLCREKFAEESGFPIWNGVRGIFMEVEKNLPAQTKIQGKTARVYFDGFKDKCFRCGLEGHVKVNCPERSSEGASSLLKQRSNSLAQVVANGSSVLQPIKTLDASSVNDQAGNNQNALDKQKKKSNENKPALENRAPPETGKGNERKDIIEELDLDLNGSSGSSGTPKPTEPYRRPWPKYR